MIRPHLPERFAHGLKLYLEEGVLPGGLLKAVLENDLERSLRLDETLEPVFAKIDEAEAARKIARGRFGPMLMWEAGIQRWAEPVELDSEYRDTAIRAAQIMGLRVAGVDMLEGKDGPQVMEVNSSPGIEGIEGATKLDVAGAMIDYIAAQVDFPEIDIRQRLTVSRGCGVAEIHVPEGSEYVGRTIEESGLREKDINVLTLYRDVSVIPNPRSKRTLEPGDRLLCFGKLESMRAMIPERERRRRKPKVAALADVRGREADPSAGAEGGGGAAEEAGVVWTPREED